MLDGDLPEEKIISLIRLGGEKESLDYKRSYDLTGKKVTKVELEMLAEVVAIANTSGGYIVLGVDEDRCGTAAAYRPNGIPQEQPGGSVSSGGSRRAPTRCARWPRPQPF